MLQLLSVCGMILVPRKQPLLERHGAVGSQYATAVPQTTLVHLLARVSQRERTQENSLGLSSGFAVDLLNLVCPLSGKVLFGAEEDVTSDEPFRKILRLNSHEQFEDFESVFG